MTTITDRIEAAAKDQDGPLLLALLAEYAQADEHDHETASAIITNNLELLLTSGPQSENGPALAAYLPAPEATSPEGISPHVEEALGVASRVALLPRPTPTQLREAQQRAAEILERAPLQPDDVETFRRIWSAADPEFASDRLLAIAEKLTSLVDEPGLALSICAARYSRFDFAAAVASGLRAAESMELRREQRLVLHRMVGVAAAHLGDEETARIQAGHLRTLRAPASAISDVLGTLALATQGPEDAAAEFSRGGTWDTVGDDILHDMAHSTRGPTPAAIAHGTAIALTDPSLFFRGPLTHGAAHIIDYGLLTSDVADHTGLHLCTAAVIASMLDGELATRPSSWPKQTYEGSVALAREIVVDLLLTAGLPDLAERWRSDEWSDLGDAPSTGALGTTALSIQKRARALTASPDLSLPEQVGSLDDAITVEAVLRRDFDANVAAASELLLTDSGVDPYADVSRNDPCPCSSGKKFKRCHG